MYRKEFGFPLGIASFLYFIIRKRYEDTSPWETMSVLAKALERFCGDMPNFNENSAARITKLVLSKVEAPESAKSTFFAV